MVLDSPLLRDEEVKAIADKHNVPAATVLISYQVNRGCIVLPKSVTPARIEQNLKVITLPQEDMEVLDGMAARGKQQRVNTPLFGHDLVSIFYVWCSRGGLMGCLGL
jgi:glycerol 2-dehydrogenase (NADP+)